jgi:hypothetical protein
MHKLSALHCAMMILLSLDERGVRRKKVLTRARYTESSLKLIGLRETITREWIDAVNEELISAGWVLINAGTTYAVVKVNVVENWPRIVSKHLGSQLDQVKQGTFQFQTLERLLKKEVWDTTTHLRGPKSRETSQKSR